MLRVVSVARDSDKSGTVKDTRGENVPVLLTCASARLPTPRVDTPFLCRAAQGGATHGEVQGEVRTSDPRFYALHHTPGCRALLLRAAQGGTTHGEVRGVTYL